MKFLGPCFPVSAVICAGSNFQTVSMYFIAVFHRFLDAYFMFAFYIPETSLYFMVDWHCFHFLGYTENNGTSLIP